MLPDERSDNDQLNSGKHEPARLKVVICWHMHQPYYKNTLTGAFVQPWTYLHATKDYIDMATILESVPNARAVINFCPILLDQIDEYSQQVNLFFTDKTPITDPLLASLTLHVAPKSVKQRNLWITQCLRANEEHLIKRFQPYERLAAIAKEALRSTEMLKYLDDQFYFDLLVWYHLAWLGETVRMINPEAQALIKQKRNYSYSDRLHLLQLIGTLLANVIPKYRKLHKNGQIEISMSPFSHPIMPLMQDMQDGCDAEELLLPTSSYPNGDARVAWQLEKGKESIQKHFGMLPVGCWPSEGGVSEKTLQAIERAGFKWLASGESVLQNSLKRQNSELPNCIHQSYRLNDSRLSCFFRDDNISDAIGFTYAHWHGDDAVNNIVHHLENIREACIDNCEKIVSIILDGENCWEYYPNNGYYFLTALYQKLSSHEHIKLTTFEDYVDQKHDHVRLDHMVAGSWVYGTFSTWIGHADKNHGWDLLNNAKTCFDRVIKEGTLSAQQVDQANSLMAICEGSDWFWWFGDYNAEVSVSDFDILYRAHLKNLYQVLGLMPPAELDNPVSVGSGDPENSGTMRRGQKTP